jgi:16S rRNA (cytosine1402-N4)-methyltransferase
LATTRDLAALIERVAPRRKSDKIHPATRVFQALRIAVNDELSTLERTLPIAIDLLRPGGRLAVISFHSLEDRIVKHGFKDASTDCICPPKVPICVCDHRATVRLLNRKPIEADAVEIAQNARSRSAKLRVVEKL